MQLGAHSWILSPLIALLAVGLIVLLCRWVFSTSSRDRRAAVARVRAASAGDFGLLVPVGTARTREDAELLREVLVSHGIRGTVAPVPHGEHALLVFRGDEERARALVG